MPPAAIRTEVIPDRTTLRLSDSLRLEIAIEGPAPLRVEMPKEWLADASAGLWKMQSLGPPSLQEIPMGQRWSQAFRLDPYVPGTPVPLIFVPVKVNDREVNLPSFSIEVTTSVVRVNVDEARPITGMESPPPRPVPPSTNHAPAIAVVSAMVALLVVLFWRRRSRAIPEPSASERSLNLLRQLEPTREGFADTLAELLREWLESQGLPAKSHTVAELRPGNSGFEPILAILDRCDLSKFSGGAIDPLEREVLRNQAMQFVMNAIPSITEPKP